MNEWMDDFFLWMDGAWMDGWMDGWFFGPIRAKIQLGRVAKPKDDIYDNLNR